MNQDEEHLRLLSIFTTWSRDSRLSAGVFPFIHITIWLDDRDGQFDGPGHDDAPAMFGWLFVVLGYSFVAMMWTLARSCSLRQTSQPAPLASVLHDCRGPFRACCFPSARCSACLR